MDINIEKIPKAKIKTAKIIEVIEVCFNRGIGTDDDPIRECFEYRFKNGNPIAEHDPMDGRTR